MVIPRIRVKGLLFDAGKVTRALSVEKRKALGRGGAFVRTRMRSLIRKRKGPSRRGAPPHGHTGRLRNRILFAYDPTTGSTVVGPLLTPRQADASRPAGTVPQILERGGRVRILKVNRRSGGARGRSGGGRRRDARGRFVTRGQTTSHAGRMRKTRAAKQWVDAKIDARPFAGPALALERQNIPKGWGAVIGG